MTKISESKKVQATQFQPRSGPIEIEEDITDYQSKKYRYAQESYFQEFWYEVNEMLGELSVCELDRFTFVVFKPDAMLGRCLRSAFDYLNQHGFRAIFYQPFTFTRHSIRELWRYELNISSRERYAAIDLLLQSHYSLFVMFYRQDRDGKSASQYLKQLKGPSILKDRDKNDFRKAINASDGTLNFVHTPDESIDFIREVGVLFPKEIRASILAVLRAGNNGEPTFIEGKIKEIEDKAYKGIPACDFDIKGIVNRYGNFDEVFDVDIYSKHGKQSIADILAQIKASGIAIEYWDNIVLEAFSMFPNTPNIERILDYEEKRFFS